MLRPCAPTALTLAVTYAALLACMLAGLWLHASRLALAQFGVLGQGQGTSGTLEPGRGAGCLERWRLPCPPTVT